MTTPKALLLATSTLAFPFGTLACLAAAGIGIVWLSIQMLREYGPALLDDPSRCPACQRDHLMRVEASTRATPIPLLHCRGCGEAFWRWNGSLIRDTGRPLF